MVSSLKSFLSARILARVSSFSMGTLHLARSCLTLGYTVLSSLALALALAEVEAVVVEGESESEDEVEISEGDEECECELVEVELELELCVRE